MLARYPRHCYALYAPEADPVAIYTHIRQCSALTIFGAISEMSHNIRTLAVLMDVCVKVSGVFEQRARTPPPRACRYRGGTRRPGISQFFSLTDSTEKLTNNISLPLLRSEGESHPLVLLRLYSVDCA